MTLLALTADDLISLHEGDALNRTAVVDNDRTFTYGEIAALVDALAARLQALGVRRKDRVIVHLPNSVDSIVAIFACWRTGAVAVNVNVQWTIEQLLYIAKDASATIALVDSRRANELEKTSVGCLQRVIVRGSAPTHSAFECWPAGAFQQVKRPIVLDCDTAAILYTSGSTGMPKGVMLTHLNLLLGARSVARYLQLRSDDRILGLLPFSFDYGLNQLLCAFLLGATIVIQSVTIPAEIVGTLAKERVNGFAAVPPVWVQVVRYLQSVPTSLPALRYVTNSGGKIPGPTLRAMTAVFPTAQIYLMYGLTESFRSTYLAPERFLEKPGAIGQAIPNVETFVIVPGEGRAKPGEEGELVHRGSLISGGYWNKPDATNAKIRSCPELNDLIGDEKVVFSGDRVRLDEDGDMWFVGRADSMFKCMGFRISPTEVETIAHQSAMVQEAVAFGVDDDLAGAVVHLCVANPGSTVDEHALMAHCRAHMPHYMIPKMIHTWQGEMPRTANGKIDAPAVVKTIKDRISKNLFVRTEFSGGK